MITILLNKIWNWDAPKALVIISLGWFWEATWKGLTTFSLLRYDCWFWCVLFFHMQYRICINLKSCFIVTKQQWKLGMGYLKILYKLSNHVISQEVEAIALNLTSVEDFDIVFRFLTFQEIKESPRRNTKTNNRSSWINTSDPTWVQNYFLIILVSYAQHLNEVV